MCKDMIFEYILQKYFMNISRTDQKQIENTQRRILNSFESHFYCQNDLYHPQNNQKGFINYSCSRNIGVSKKSLQYLPQFITLQNLAYPPFKSSYQLNQILAQDTPYSVNETFALNNLLAVLDAFSAQKKISVQGYFCQLQVVLSHAKAQLVSKSQSQCHIIFAMQNCQLQKYTKINEIKDKPVLIVIGSSNQIIPTQNANVLFAYEKSYSQGFIIAVCHGKNIALINQLQKQYMIYHVSTLISTIVEHNHFQGPSSDKEAYINQVNANIDYLKNYLLMIENQPQRVSISKDNIFFGIGVIACLVDCMMTIFDKGDIVSSDIPFYNNFQLQFHRSGIIFNLNSIFQGKLHERAKASFQKGSKGYFIVNPHNPTGLIYSAEQIFKTCEWAKSQPSFHLVFDQIYVNSVIDSKYIMKSAIQYANSYPNIHVSRGFAKDFGLCGFKVGILVSCNKKILQNFVKWKKLRQPQQFILKSVSKLLEVSDYGQHIYKHCQESIRSATDLVMQLLEKYNIKFLRPQGGGFLLLNLTQYLAKNPKLSQIDLWLKIFYDYKVNLVPGRFYKIKQEGYFRMCYVLQEYSIREGLARLHRLLKQQSAFES